MNLAYLAEPKYGGWVTFTAHLALSLRHVGNPSPILKEAKKTGRKPFSHGLDSHSVTSGELIAKAKNTLITAVDKHNLDIAAQMLMNGARLVIHDPNEFHPGLFEIAKAKKKPIVTIRRTVQEALQKMGLEAALIPHPFISQFTEEAVKTSHACSISRVDFDKHTAILVEANLSLDGKRSVKIYGAMNRMYEHFKLKTLDPKWNRNYYGTFPMNPDSAERIAARHLFTVDLSVIKNDGGGTQYTFLEAWAQGSHLIVNRKWLIPGDVMQDGVNCTAVGDAKELIRALEDGPNPDIVSKAKSFINGHTPDKTAKRLIEICKFA